MRQKYLLMFTLFLAFTFTNYAQTPIITHVVDGTCGSDAKFVELYISGSVDLSEYKLVRRSNDGTWADDGADIDLSAFGTKTDEFIYVIRDLATLNTEFPSAGIDVDNSIVSGSVSHNGDDSYRIVEIAGDVVIDQFGADTDGTGEPWEYVDSWGNRNNEAGPNPTFDISEWTFNALDALDDTGICNSDPDAVPPVVYPPLEDTVTTLGSYQVASAGENGEICSTAFVVDQIPFNDSGDTANTGDNYSETDRPVIDNAQVATGNGSGLYLNGNDTVYEFTPATDGTFTFELSNHVTWVGFWLFEGCEPFTNTVAYHLGSSSTGRTFSDLSLTGGETYYVVISTYPTPQTTTYTLDITQITCPAPSDLVNDLVTTTSADFSWTAGASETGGYEYVVMPEGLNPIDDFADNVDNGTTAAGVTTVSSTGLSPNTAYDFYVLALCDAGDTSDYVSVSFETPCSAFTPDYSEDFASYVPDCWEVAGAGDPTTGPSDFGSSLWSHDQFLNATGTNNSVNINLYTNSREDWLISPTFDLSAGGYELVYIAAVTDYQNSDVPEGNGMGSDDEVQVLITEDDGLTWTALRTYSQSDFPSETGDFESIDLSAYTGNVQIAFWGTDGAVADSEDYDFFIDEFEVRTPPNCFDPTGLSVTNVTTDSADLNWDDDVDALNGYNWVIYTSPSDPEVDTAVDSGTAAAGMTMTQVTGLMSQTDYDFYLSSDCDTNGVSSLAGPVTFTTECAAFAAPFLENFDDNGTALPNCWTQTSTVGVWSVNTTPTFGNTYSDNTSGSGSFALVDASVANQGNDITLTTPFVDVSTLTSPALEFFVYHFKSQNATDNIISVEVWDGAAWNQVYFDDTANFEGWEQVIVDLSSLTLTGDIQARFIVDSTPNNFYNDIAIDDVSFDEGPACFAPTSLLTSNISGTSVDFSWDGTVSSVNGYEWAIIEEGVGDITDAATWVDTNITDVSTTNASSNVLLPETAYEVYVRTDCDTEGQSEWTSTTFTTTVLCPTPSSLVLDSVDINQASFSWMAATAETGGYEYVIMPEGLDPIVDFADNVDNGTTAAGVTTASSTALTPNTAYDFYVLALCDASETSDYISILFETPCSAFTPDYLEDFASYVPDCWEEAGSGDPTTGPSDFGSSLWSHDQFLNATGTNNSVNINLYTNSREDWLISPTFDLSAGGYELVYIAAVTDYQNSDVPEGNGMGSDDEVQVLITEDDGLTWTALRTYNQSDFPSETGDLETIDLSAYTGNVRFAFWGTDGAVDDPEDYDFFIDEFEVRTPPNCFEPTGLNVTNITVNSADLNWDDDVAALNGYNWSVYASPSDPEVDTAVDSGTAAAGETMVQVTGLTPDTDYDFYLSSDCDTNGVSSLAGPESFFTGYCAPVHTSTFDYVVSLETIGAEQNVSITQTVQGPNQGYQDLTDQTIEAFIDSSFDVDVTYSFGTFGFKAWVDWNNDLVFAEDEVIFTDENTTASAISTFVVPDDVLAGDYRVRFRAYWPNDEDPGSCESITWGDAFDYTLTVSEAAPAFANVQVIHNSPDPAAASVDVYLDGALLDDLTGVNFREATGFLLAPADVDIVIDVVPAGGDISTSVFTQTLNLVEDENYIIVANGVLDPTAFITDNAFELSIYAGARTVAADPADVDVLVHHGSPDAPAVDVNEVTAGNLVANIAYPEFQGYLSLPEADYTLEIAAAGTPDALLTYSAPLATLGGFEGTAITVIASGFLGDDAGTDNGFGLWVATAAGGPLLELPLIEPDPVFANVQVIHNSPDPAAASVDVYLNGALLTELTGVNFREASAFLSAPADVDIVIDVVPAGGDISTSVFTQTLNLVEDENYIIVANGVLDPTAFITDNAFELSIYAGARTVAADPADVDVLVHHGSPDAPAVDVNEVTAGNLVANIAYPEFQGYLSLPEADYTLEIAAAGTPDALLTYSAPLATLGGFEGTAITVIASGFLGDDAGTDNGFGLWVATAAGGPLLELPLVEDDGPMDPAPDPIEDPENVISLFSGVYTNVTVDTWLTPWSSADLEDIQIQGNDTKLYTNLDFAGIETVANPIDATEMDFFHIDVWSPNATTFRVKLVDLGSGAVEGEIAFDIAQEEWVSLQIPLDDFADADVVTDPNNLLTVRNSIQQLIISGLPVGAVTAYVDNVYFSDDPSVSTIDFDADNFTYYPNPVNSELRIEANNTIEQVEVFNVLGQRVISQRPNQTNPILDMNNLEAGVYLMKVSIDGTNKTFQIIKD